MEFGVCIPNSPFSERTAYSLKCCKPCLLQLLFTCENFHDLANGLPQTDLRIDPKSYYQQRDPLGALESINAPFRVHEGYTLLLPNYKIFIARFFFSVVWYLKRSELSILSSHFQNDDRKEQNFLQRENVKALQKEDCKMMGVVWKLLELTATTGVIALMKQMD